MFRSSGLRRILGLNVLFAALAVASTGCGGGAHAVAGETGPAATTKRISKTVTVPPGRSAELIIEMAQGSRVLAKFRGQKALRWDIRSRESGLTTYYEKGKSRKGQLSFTAETSGGYSLSWANDSISPQRLRVLVELSKGVIVDSWSL